MLNSKGFNLWADGYDRSVGASDDEKTYPFAGYRDILNRIFQMTAETPEAAVLDLGFGTGTLTAALYQRGCRIFGQDFLEKMIGLAAAKMPRAVLCRGDFTRGLAEPLTKQRYDFIIATYSRIT